MAELSIVILTALPVEQAAVVAAVGNGVDRSRGGHPFHEGQVAGRRVRIVPTGGPGHAHAAEAGRRAVDVWNPDRILLVGIAGGARNSGEVRLGDVLVPDQVLGYEPDGPRNRWGAYRPAADLLDAARQLPPGEWRNAWAVAPPDGAGGRPGPAVHFGTVLSGEKVLARGPIVARLRRGWPRTIGLEMESLGSAIASYRGGPGFLVVKAVSGFARGKTAPRPAAGPADVAEQHRYAAEAAARFAVAVLRREPGRSDSGRPQAVPAGGPVRFASGLRILVCRRLGEDWYDLADWFDIRTHDTARFVPGKEPRDLWEWLEGRDKLHALPAALRAIGREDLAAPLEKGDPD